MFSNNQITSQVFTCIERIILIQVTTTDTDNHNTQFTETQVKACCQTSNINKLEGLPNHRRIIPSNDKENKFHLKKN